MKTITLKEYKITRESSPAQTYRLTMINAIQTGITPLCVACSAWTDNSSSLYSSLYSSKRISSQDDEYNHHDSLQERLTEEPVIISD